MVKAGGPAPEPVALVVVTPTRRHPFFYARGEAREGAADGRRADADPGTPFEVVAYGTGSFNGCHPLLLLARHYPWVVLEPPTACGAPPP